MALIGINPVTEKFGASSKNLDAVLGITESPSKEKVITQVALESLAEIKGSRLGWGHSFKKFFATTLTYASVLALPITILAGAIWYYADLIKGINLVYAGSGLGAVLAADFAVGKLFGTRPITAILIASYDAYRQGAQFLAKQVRDGYTSQEGEVKSLIEDRQKMIEDELQKAYLGMASELATRHQNKTLKNEVPTLKTVLPSLSTALTEIGLSATKVSAILSPLKETIRLIESS